MKKFTFLKTLLMMLLLTIGSISILAQTEVTYTFADKGFNNAQIITNGSIDANLNYLAEKNSSSTAPTYYTLGSALRMYAGSGNGNSYTITTLNGVKITSIEIYALASYTPSVKYNIDGGDDIEATLNGTTYTITGIEASTSLKFRNALASGTTPQLRITGFKVTYTTSSTPTVAAPTFDPAAGTYTSAQNVTISTTTDGASIYYTTNGDEPTESSTLYTAPVAISTTTTLKAKAYKAGMDPSATATAVYTINQAPTITVTETALSGFTYVVDNGPSDAQQFTFSGSNLTEDLTVTAPANYQISIDGANDNYHNSLAFTPVSGSVANTSLYVRLIAGLTAGDYTGNITLTSTGAAQKTIALSGKVTLPVVKPAVIISEVYGGGGNSGATLINDFIELYNTSNETVEIGGWSVQYYSENGNGAATESNIFVIPEGKYIPAGAHFLIKAAAGSGGTEYLFQPDAACNLALRATGGKIILYNTSAAQNITDINSITSNPNFVDYVPYGTTAVPVWGSAMSSNTSNTTSASRKIVPPALIGAQKVRSAVNYVYTGNIGNDFTVTTPSPTSTGLNTGVNNTKLELSIYPSNGKIHFNATSGEKIEIFNAVGQRIVNKLSTDGLNSISVDAKGVLLVKVGERIGKVIL